MPRIRDAYGSDPDRVPFDFYELVGALAPRTFFSNSPLRDSNFSIDGVKKGIAEAQKVYDLLGVSDRLRSATRTPCTTSCRRSAARPTPRSIALLGHTPVRQVP